MLLLSFNSTALTLGRLRGVALIGQPLDVAVPVQLGEGESATSQCFTAEVFHADIQQDASRVRVLISPVQDQTLSVRILSLAMVDEPVVTVNLQAGCTQKTSRHYVLLADVPSEAASQSTASTPPLVTLVPAPLVQRPVKTPPSVMETATRASKPSKPKKSTEPVVNKLKGDGAVVQNKTQRPSGQPRLKLDPLELFSDRVAGLDSFMNFDLPEDALRNAQRLKALEATVKSSLALAAKNDASFADLKLRLEKAESERVPAEWLYGLMALALAGFAGLAYLLFRQRSRKDGNDDWMNGAASSPASALIDPVLQAAPRPLSDYGELDFELPEDLAPEIAPSEFSLHHEPMAEVDVHLVEMSDSKFDSFMTTGSERLPSLAPSLPKTPAHPKELVLNFNAEATLDIRQQAEFFVSLGQTGRAIRILKKKIDSGDNANPFLYLDLLGLYHSLKQKVDYQELREEFNALFSGVVPEFSKFKSEGSDLEFYSEELNHISDLWPRPEVLDLIETYIFQDPRNPKSRSFALAAFRELLLLHSVAQSMLSPPQTESTQSQDDASSGMGSQNNDSLNFSDMDFTEPAKLSLHPNVAGAHDAGLDLDLDLSDSSHSQAHPKDSSMLKFDLPKPPHKG